MSFPRSLKWLAGNFLKFCRIRPEVGGLEISDTALRYAIRKKGNWQFAAVRLPPGTLEGGRIKNPGQFAAALESLRRNILGKPGRRKKISAVLTLSSVGIYNQVFTLPFLKGENLDRAVQLNIQMAAPEGTAETYTGWQLVNRDENRARLEILAEFVNRKIVDDLLAALKAAGFWAHSAESRASALVRTIRALASGFDAKNSYLAVSVDGSGLQFAIIRDGQLYFEYFNSWKDMYGDSQTVSEESFRTGIIRSVHQVLNYYNSHWTEPLAGIYLLAGGITPKVEEIVRNNFPLAILAFGLRAEPDPGAEWYVALGAALRGEVPHREDDEISLLGITAREEFRQEQTLAFFRFWELVFPVTMGLLLAAFLGARFFLSDTRAAVESSMILQVGARESEEIADLEARVRNFNSSVNMIGRVLDSRRRQLPPLAKIQNLLQEYDIQLVRYYFQNPNQPVIFQGEAASEDALKNFVAALQADPEFAEVNLPLSEIRVANQRVVFSMTFLRK